MNNRFFVALVPISLLIVFLGLNVYFFSDDASYGPNQIALLLSAALAALLAMRLNFSWTSLREGIVDSISTAMPSILILLIIGSLAGTWLVSGIVPALIYYGLELLNPTIFLMAACIVCALVSLATGSSWSTIATVGVALLGIGKAMGMEDGIIAGAIISGAYFGDKMSPLSDTTNLAPAMAGTDLFTHIRYMTITTVPSILITLAIFLGIGLSFEPAVSEVEIDALQNALAAKFNISLWLFLVPLAVIGMIIAKVPALPALLVGTLLGGVFMLVFQPHLVAEVAAMEGSFWATAYVAVNQSMFGDVAFITGNATVDELLSSGGMAGMMNTVWLILCAMIFGGIMEKAGFLKAIADVIISAAKSTGSLVASTAGTALFFNVTASDQYLAIVVPGRMFAPVYRERGLAPQNLSRTLEDAGTVTSVLIPWNTCGAYQTGVLGVATGEYFFYCFFNLISPFMTVLFAYLGIKIAKLSPAEMEEGSH